MMDRRPVAVVTDAINLPGYQQSHSIGIQLLGFEHLFHTSVETDDVIPATDMWAPAKAAEELEEPEGSFSGEESDVDTAEIRSKMREDRVDESDENSGRSMNPDEVDNSDEEVSGLGDETDDQEPIKKERIPSPTIESAPWLHKDDQYERRTEAAQDTGEVPTSEHSGGAHDMVQDEADEGETDNLSLPMDICQSC
jgi:hypothetical protein